MRSQIDNRKSQIVIVGGGPAGSSLAIRLANAGFGVTLLERSQFPRPKLCGEFISPECLQHFRELSVFDRITAAGGHKINETRFYSISGRSVAIPSGWFAADGLALSLSRARMDLCLLERACSCGVKIHEGANVTRLEIDHSTIASLSFRDSRGDLNKIVGDIFIDATGRTAQLSRLLARSTNEQRPGSSPPSIVGFKVHVRNAVIEPGRCEIYSFPGGYGGLTPVENGLANHCFMIKADRLRELGGPDRIVESLIFKNARARHTLAVAEPATRWISVAIQGFGKRAARVGTNAFSVGDAAAFIDPFTGSGILMALESSKMLAESIIDSDGDPTGAASLYSHRHARAFGRRLSVSSLLRHAAFRPAAGTLAVATLSVSHTFSRNIASLTRRP